MSKVISVSRYINEKETALVGRDNGTTFRQKVESDVGRFSDLELDSPIKFMIPNKIVTMNKSFFLGAFADRVISLGREGFLEKYDFSSSEFIDESVASYIEYALKKGSMREILNN